MTSINASLQKYSTPLLPPLRKENINFPKKKAMNETTQSALLYAKFRSSSSPLKSIVKEIEQRSYDHEEYASLLNECYQAYFGIRIRLITPIIMSRMAEISGNKEIVPYVFWLPFIIFVILTFLVSFCILVFAGSMYR